MSHTVYLAGPIKGLNYGGATSWRLEAARRLEPDIICLDPMRGKGYLRDADVISDHYETILSSMQAITHRDRFDVMRCDLMLANLLGCDPASIGTAIEFGWADAFRKPIVTIMQPGDTMYHGMIRTLSLAVVPDLDTAVDVVRHILLPGSVGRE